MRLANFFSFTLKQENGQASIFLVKKIAERIRRPIKGSGAGPTRKAANAQGALSIQTYFI